MVPPSDDFALLKKKIARLEKRVSALENQDTIEEPEEQQEVEETKETSKPIENLGFKIFGAVGFALILLGVFYLYRFAVDQGWIGVLGRIVLGLIFSLAIIVCGEVFRRKEYTKFSHLMMGGGVGLLYFTFYATYHFSAYREALGMSLAVNTSLLFLTMLFGVYLAMRQNSLLLTVFAFLLGYVAAFLSGGAHEMMITALLLSAGLTFILWKKNWNIAVLPVIASYILYMVFFFESRVFRSTASTAVVAVTFAYLIAFFLLFNLLSVLLKQEGDNIQNILVMTLTGLFTLVFGLTIVLQHMDSFRGVFVIVLAAIYVLFARMIKGEQRKKLFTALLITATSLLTIAIPVQLQNNWIGIAWAAEGVLLLYAGIRMKSFGIRILGYGVLGLAVIGGLINMIFSDGFDRILVSVGVIVAGYIGAHLLSKSDLEYGKIGATIVGLITTIFLTIALAAEVTDYNGMFNWLTSDGRQVLLTVLWAAESIFLITFGFLRKSWFFRLAGITLFIITVAKLLFVDLDNLSAISRTVVSILVGIIALGGSFAYVKNKEKIERFIKSE